MRLDEEGVGSLVSVMFVVFIIIMGFYLWTIDILTYERQFGTILGGVLLAFALLMHVRWAPSWSEVKKNWLLAGCAFLIVILVLAAL